MTTTNFPNGVTSFGVQVPSDGIPAIGANNTYWFVSSVTGNAGNSGTVDEPFATLAAAAANTALAANDVIVVLPGHAETVIVAGGITLSTAGVQVVGLGTGTQCPTLTFSTATTASMLISGAGVSVSNIRGIAGINSLANPFNVTGASVTLDIDWTDSTYEALRAVLATSVTDLKVWLRYHGLVGGSLCVNAVRLTGATAAKMTDSEVHTDFYGKVTTGVVEFTGNAASVLGIRVGGFTYVSGTTTGAKDVVDTATGSTYWVSLNDGSAGTTVTGNSSTAAVASSSGAFFYVQKTLVSSTVVQSAPVDITTVAAGGDVMVRYITLETNGTGLAGASAVFQIKKSAGSGALTVGAQAITGLGANTTLQATAMAGTAASLPLTLETGAKLQAQAGTADCTGAGTIKVTLLCQRVSAGSTLTNA